MGGVNNTLRNIWWWYKLQVLLIQFQYVTIFPQGDAQDFGDLSVVETFMVVRTLTVV